MLDQERRGVLRGTLILVVLGFCLISTVLFRAPAVRATDYSCWCQVVIVVQGEDYNECWAIHSVGTACSGISCQDAWVKATQDAVNNMPSRCSSLPYYWESEYWDENSGCIP
jgi:hypothetical protein